MATDLRHLFAEPEWQAKAQCKGTDSGVFFGHAAGGYYKDDANETRLDRIAKSICAVCEVKTDCLNFAIDTNQKEGIWGGTTPKERRRLRRQRLRSTG